MTNEKCPMTNVKWFSLKSAALPHTHERRYHPAMLIRLLLVMACVAGFGAMVVAQTVADRSQVSTVTSSDGTRIALECTGKGPNLLIVHGGAGDRRRWKPLLPLFATHFA